MEALPRGAGARRGEGSRKTAGRDDLDRFVEAQHQLYKTALKEINAGRKRTDGSHSWVPGTPVSGTLGNFFQASSLTITTGFQAPL